MKSMKEISKHFIEHTQLWNVVNADLMINRNTNNRGVGEASNRLGFVRRG